MADSASLKQQTLDSFCDLLRQFAEACIQVWPEDAGLREMKLGFDMAITNALTESLRQTAKEQFIVEYHESMQPFYARCNQRDPTVFTEGSQIEFMRRVNMREKWLDSSIDDDTRDCVWEYILQLNHFSQLYCTLLNRIPEQALTRIQSTAMNIAEQARSADGSIDISNINLHQIGADVMQSMPEEELQAFSNQLLSDPASLTSLCTNVLNNENLGGSASAVQAALQMMSGQLNM